MAKTQNKFTEDWLPVKKIENGMIILENNWMVTGIKVEPKNIFILDYQTQNNIIGLGDANFYNSAGVSPILFGGESKSSLALSYSTLVDYGFVEHLYNQYMNFINFRLRQVSSKYRWEILMYGNKYTESEDIKTRQTLVQSLNMP